MENDLARSLDVEKLNVYRIMAHNPAILEGFREYASTLWAHCGLTPRERELLILTVAAETNAAYEWHQHVRVALDEGLAPDEIRTVASGDLERFEPHTTALTQYTAQFVTGAIDKATHERLVTHYNDHEIIGICSVAGLYLGLAHLLTALEIETEVEFVGWDLEHL